MSGPERPMDRLVIKDIEGLTGSYECDLATLGGFGDGSGRLTAREGHRLKVMSGVLPPDLLDAMSKGDTDVWVAVAAIVLTRAGKYFDEDLLWDAPLGSVTFEVAKRPEEPDAGPPAGTPPTEQSRNGGDSSSISLVPPPESGQRATGVPRSATSATLGHPI